MRFMLLPLLVACSSAEPAPTELTELAAFLFTAFEDDDPTSLAEGVENLDLALADIDLSADPDDRSWTVGALTAAELEGIEHPDRPVTDLVSLGIAHESPFPVADHTAYMVLTDLTELGGTTDVYDRTVLEPADPACFADASCEWLRTDNHVVADNFLLTMTWDQTKDYRWITLASGEQAIVSRGWIPVSAVGTSGANNIWQSYEVDAWIPRDGATIRFYGVWSESEYSGLGEDAVWNLSQAAAVDALTRNDVFLAE